MSFQGLLNNPGTLLIPTFGGLAIAGALERFTKLALEPSEGVWVKCYGNHYQMLVFSSEDVEKLWGFKHLCDRFIVEVFEVLEVALRPSSTRFVVHTHVILVMLIDLRDPSFRGGDGDQSIGLEGVPDCLP